MGTATLVGSILLGHQVAAGTALVRPHFMLALLATTLLVAAHSFIMFFLIATGVELKDREKERGGGDAVRRQVIRMKARVFPVMTLALLLVIANFILGAAAHTRAIPGWAHGIVAWSTLTACLVALYREYRVLGENNRLIAATPFRREDTPPTPPG